MNGASTLSQFLDGGSADEQVALRAWLCEAKAASWADEQAIQSAYPLADVTKPPRVIFRLLGGALSIHTLVRLAVGVVFIDQIRSDKNAHALAASRRSA